MRAFVKRWRWVCLISCVAAAAVALAACGSDEPASDTAPAQRTAASMTQPTAAPAVPATQPPSTAMPEPTAAPTAAAPAVPATQPPSTAMPEPTAAPTAAAATESVPSVEVGLDVGQRAPDFTLTSHEGESITRASLEGRPVLLYFYTTW